MENPKGFLRIEETGKRVHYLVMKNEEEGREARRLHNMLEVQRYLKVQQASGYLLSIEENMFDFKKTNSLALKRRKLTNKNNEIKIEEEMKKPKLSDIFSDNLSDIDTEYVVETLTKTVHDDENEEIDEGNIKRTTFKMENLIKKPCSSIDHKKELQMAADDLETFRKTSLLQTNSSTEKVNEMKSKLVLEETISGMVMQLCTDEEGLSKMSEVIEDKVLSELLTLHLSECEHPLSDFPNNINRNWFSETVRFAMKASPITLKTIVNLVVKDRDQNISTKNVVSIAVQYAQLAAQVNQHNNALVKIQSLQLEMEHLSDEGMNAQAKLGLSLTSMAVSKMRDDFAEVSEKVLLSMSEERPQQLTLDNCDFRSQSIMVEFMETETVDTNHLSTEQIPAEEVASLFTTKLLVLNAHEEEKIHLEKVIATEIVKLLSTMRPDEFGNLSKYLPSHHQHPLADMPVKPAETYVGTRYFQENRNDEVIEMVESIQRDFLDRISKMKDNDAQFLKDYEVIYTPLPKCGETESEKILREEAEHRIAEVVREFGELIVHGDLLTIKMIQQAIALRAGSARAVDRFAYVGPLIIQLFHLMMNKTAQDLKAAMPDARNVGDIGSLSNVSSIIGTSSWLSNNKKKIVKTGNYEKHDQHLIAWQSELLCNAFHHFLKSEYGTLAAVKDFTSTLTLACRFLNFTGVSWSWDPDFQDTRSDVTCQLYNYSRDQLSRLIIHLAFKACERENDALGLRALRRINTTYFLNKSKSQTSKYASFLCSGLVTEASQSQRTRARMDQYVTINTTGQKGEGLFRDKVNEIYVRLIKTAFRNQHSALKHITIATMVQSASVMASLHEHNLRSCLLSVKRSKGSHDLVGQDTRELIREVVEEADPFNLQKEPETEWSFQPRSSPFADISQSDIERFLMREKEKHMLLHRDPI